VTDAAAVAKAKDEDENAAWFAMTAFDSERVELRSGPRRHYLPI